MKQYYYAQGARKERKRIERIKEHLKKEVEKSIKKKKKK